MNSPFQASQKKIGDYIIDKVLGSGQFGSVYLAYSFNKLNNQKLFAAIKQISKNKLNQQQQTRLNEEKDNLAYISHINIIQIYEVIETGNNYYLVMEYCNGGDLRSLFKQQQNNRFQEQQAQIIAAQILIGLKLLRDIRILHRDIKPENIMIHNFENQPILKLADFGLSKKLKKGDLASTMCGAPLYTAPEIQFQQQYDFKADL